MNLKLNGVQFLVKGENAENAWLASYIWVKGMGQKSLELVFFFPLIFVIINLMFLLGTVWIALLGHLLISRSHFQIIVCSLVFRYPFQIKI